MSALILGFFLLVLGLVGALAAATPWLTPKSECFTVTVPASALVDPRLRSIRRIYLAAMLAATALAMVSAVILWEATGAGDEHGAEAWGFAVTGLVLALEVVSFALMLGARSRVRRLKAERGWHADAARRTAVVGEALPGPLSLVWDLLYLLPVGAFALAAWLTYPELPAEIATNVGLDGVATATVAKSPAVATAPVLVATFLAVVFTFTHAVVRLSVRPLNPAAPVASGYDYGRFARIQTQLVVFGGLALTSVVGLVMELAFLGVLPMMGALAILLVAIGTVLVVVIEVSVLYGQSGSRLGGAADGVEAVGEDGDWRLGILYFDRDDASVVVPKRFGVGWTVNLARPQAWLLIGALVLIVCLFVWLVDAAFSW